MAAATAGIRERHSRRCATTIGGRACSCAPTWQAEAYDARTDKKVRRTFRTRSEAKRWRDDMRVAIRRGEVAPTQTLPTIGEAVEQWLEDAAAGRVRKRNRAPFAPTTIRAVRQNWTLRLEDRFARTRLDRVSLLDLQEFVDELEARDVSPGTIESTILPLRLVYRRAKTRGLVAVDPTDGLELPMKERGRRRPPTPEHAVALLDALPEDERALWATAMFTGLRRGELLALTWEDVDLDGGTLRVERSWNPAEGYGPPKSVHGRRTVPLTRRLVPVLRAHMLRTGRRTGLLFTMSGDTPMAPGAAQARADKAWKAAGLERVTLHACRHLYASLGIASGVNAHALCKFMGHSSIAVTFDLYGHMFPGNEAEAAGLIDGYLDQVAAAKL